MLRYRSTLEKLIAENSISDRVVWTGDLSSQEMGWCYKNCLAFAMTSRVESFGIIAVEAMAAGAVCVSTNNSCLPEIFADAAVFYSPGDHVEITEKILKATSLPERKLKEVTQKAIERSSYFSWDICAEQTVAQLKKAISNNK